MNRPVSKTAPYTTPKKRAKSLAEISQELMQMTHHEKLTSVGGAVFQIRRRRKLCGGIVPQ